MLCSNWIIEACIIVLGILLLLHVNKCVLTLICTLGPTYTKVKDSKPSIGKSCFNISVTDSNLLLRV